MAGLFEIAYYFSCFMAGLFAYLRTSLFISIYQTQMKL